MENIFCACIVITCACLMYITIMEIIDRIKEFIKRHKKKKSKKLRDEYIAKLKGVK